jgi:hypothetical protein
VIPPRLPLPLAFLVSLPVFAAQYGAEIDIDNENDLYELHVQQQITDDELETLLELLLNGINLDVASREEIYALPGLTYAQVDAILEFRRVSGPIVDPVVLVQAGVLTAEELQRLAPFLIVSERRTPLPVGGKVELQSRYTLDDRLAPPAMLRGTLRLPRDFSAGIVAMTTRFRPGALRYEPLTDTLFAEPLAYRPQLPKYYLRWKTPQRQVVAGTFRLGFGERLTLDNTRRRTPSGPEPDNLTSVRQKLSTLCRYSTSAGGDPVCDTEDLRNRYDTPDYAWAEGFRGVAGSVEDLNLSEGARLALHGFASYQARAVYQYQLYDRARCDNPRDVSRACRAPPIFEEPSGLEVRQLAFATLPGVFDELAGGGNATLVLDERIRVGLTGYYAAPYWRVPGAQLDLQEWARYPFGGPYGALGLMGSTVAGAFRLYIEGARSFDSMADGGGGFGIVQRSVYSQKKRELEASVRHYGRGFANPYARPISAPDLHEGQRARDETGLRLLYLDRPNEDWRFRAQADVWTNAQLTRNPAFDVLGRAEFLGFAPRMKLSSWVRHRRGLCLVEGEFVEEAAGETFVVDGEEVQITCGSQYRAAGRAQFAPLVQRLSFAVQYQHSWIGEDRQDLNAVFEVAYRPIDFIRLKLRTRYLFQNIATDEKLERSSWTYAEVSWLPTRLFAARLRYDVLAYLDQRERTALRNPNPEYRLWLRLESRF